MRLTGFALQREGTEMFLPSIQPSSKHTHTHTHTHEAAVGRKIGEKKKRVEIFQCLGQSLPEDRYLRFPFMKYSVSASPSSCEWQRRPSGALLSASPVQAGLSTPLLSWGGSVTVSLPCAPLSLPVSPGVFRGVCPPPPPCLPPSVPPSPLPRR